MGEELAVLNEVQLHTLIFEILAVSDKPRTLPQTLCDLSDLLNKVDFEKCQEDILISQEVQYEESSFEATLKPKYEQGPIYDGKGVLIGQKITKITEQQFESAKYGFELWLLPQNRLALHLFSEESHTSGRCSGPGYTGSEGTNINYNTSFRKKVQIVGSNQIVNMGDKAP